MPQRPATRNATDHGAGLPSRHAGSGRFAGADGREGQNEVKVLYNQIEDE